MGQAIFIALFFITLLAGIFSYYAPSQKALNPLGFMMDKTGYSSEVSVNHKKTRALNMTTSRGLMQVRKEMDQLALEQEKFLDTIMDQQQVLKNANKQANDILLEAEQKGEAGGKDILQLQALAEEMQDEQRLLVTRGKDLIALNAQVTKTRQWIADQIDLANINTESSLNSLQQRYDQLKEQSAGFFDQVSNDNQQVRDSMTKMQDRLNDLANNANYSSSVQQQAIKERIERMLDKEREDTRRLSDTQERSKNLLQDAQQNLADAQQRINDKMQETRDKIDEERQKQEDQQVISRQSIADQEQKMQDQQDMRNH